MPLCYPKSDTINETSGEEPTQDIQESTAVVAKGDAIRMQPTKRRGRPRKDISRAVNVKEAVDRPTKKRGRQPKNLSPKDAGLSIDDESDEQPPKKRRGRPPMSSTEKIGGIPTKSETKRDNPPKQPLQKDVAPTGDEGNQSQPTKRRGRPRKLPLCTKAGSTDLDSSDMTKQPAKEIGRPPKQCLQKDSTANKESEPPRKKRGRPPKKSITQNVETLKQPRKRRGRPPKSSGNGNEEQLATRRADPSKNSTMTYVATQRPSATEELATVRRTSRRQSIPTDFYIPGFDELLQKSLRESQKATDKDSTPETEAPVEVLENRRNQVAVNSAENSSVKSTGRSNLSTEMVDAGAGDDCESNGPADEDLLNDESDDDVLEPPSKRKRLLPETKSVSSTLLMTVKPRKNQTRQRRNQL